MTDDIHATPATSRRAALISVLGPVVLSACGGGSSEPAPPPGPAADTPPPPPVPGPATPPTIMQAPADATVLAGTAASFAVSASSGGDTAYQWLRNGEAIAGATGASLTYAPVSLLESGALFSARVSNAAGALTSEAATLTVTSPELTVIAGSVPFPSGGTGSAAAELDGVGASASFGRIGPLAADDAGNVYVASVATTTNSTDAVTAIRKVAADGTVTPFAGVWGQSASVDGTGSQARFVGLVALSFDRFRKLLLAVDRPTTSTLRMCEVTLAGEVTTLQSVAATAQFQFGSPSVAAAWLPDGTAYLAGGTFQMFRGLTFQLMPTAIFKLVPGGAPVLLAGDPQAPGVVDGVGTNARFSEIRSMAADRAGNVYVMDGARLRSITPDGAVKTIAGIEGSSSTAVDGQGAAAVFPGFAKLAVDDTGNIFVLDGMLVRRVTPAGRVVTLARLPVANEYDLAIGAGGRLYVRGGGFYNGSGGWVGRFDAFPA